VLRESGRSSANATKQTLKVTRFCGVQSFGVAYANLNAAQVPMAVCARDMRPSPDPASLPEALVVMMKRCWRKRSATTNDGRRRRRTWARDDQCREEEDAVSADSLDGSTDTDEENESESEDGMSSFIDNDEDDEE
jgi:hypothetical protein